jgi:hypothetical protein
LSISVCVEVELFKIAVADATAVVSVALEPTVYWPGLVPSVVLLRYQFAESTAFCKVVLLGGGVELPLLLQEIINTPNDKQNSAAIEIILTRIADFMIAKFLLN